MPTVRRGRATRMRALAALLLVAGYGTAGCAGARLVATPDPPAPPASAHAQADAERAAVAARLAEVGAALVAGDAEGCGAVFVPDAVYLVNGRSPLHGRAAIVELYRARLAITLFHSIAITPTRVQRVGRTLYEWGTSVSVTVPRATPDAAPTRSGGQYLTVWTLGDDGRWYIQWDAPMVRQLTPEEMAAP